MELTRPISHLVDLVSLTELVELGVHGVEHGHHFHGGDLAADGGESDYVTEQYRHVLERLERTENCIVIISNKVSFCVCFL
jgi:hypothetical protein